MSLRVVLVVGTSIDPHIGAVLQQLPASVTALRLDVDRYPREIAFSLEIRAGQARGYLSDSQTDILVPDLLWFRRLGVPGLPAAIKKRYKKFAMAEANHSLEAILALAEPAAAINPHLAARRAANKPLQYREAAVAGLKVPDTIISNSLDSLRPFLTRAQLAVTKTLSAPLISSTNDRREFTFTQVFSREAMPLAEELKCAPVQAQMGIVPSFEVRVTTIGSVHHAVRISAEQHTSARGTRDWRSEDSELSYEWIAMPSAIGRSLEELLRRLGLQFAASDFIVDEDGDWHFLESNPHGAWLWLEEELGSSRITESFARYIMRQLDGSYQDLP